ncbi:MAG: PTS sugar transporter subunit IIA [Victivallales bacterium]|nr:PTS sugar transporter subunit IIA [Victivallales bacterium]
MILTLKELSEHLKVNDRTILRMLKTGQIQGVKIGGQWRFNGSQIDNIFFPGHINSDDVPLEEFTQSQFAIPVSRLINEERIFLNMKATNVEEAINELTVPSLFNTLVLDVPALRANCLARENLLSTGVGNGLAIPHPRDPVPSLKAAGCVVIGRSSKGIPFNAPDGKPVKLFFLIVSQTIQLHLHLMGRMSNLMRNTKFIQVCLKAKDPALIIRAIMEHERDEFLKKSDEQDE